jgi:OOP family OmpA-OmpF porin
MPIRPSLAILAGAVLTGVSAFLLAEPVARDFIPRMETQAAEAIEAPRGHGSPMPSTRCPAWAG